MANLIGIGKAGADGYGKVTSTSSIGGVGRVGGTGLRRLTPLSTGNEGDRILGIGGAGGTGHVGPVFYSQFVLPDLNAVMYTTDAAPGRGGNGGTGLENRSSIYTNNGNDIITGIGGNGGVGEHGLSTSYCPEYSFGGEEPKSGIPGRGGTGIDNRGYLNTGNGNDVITGLGGNYTEDSFDWWDKILGKGGTGIDNRGHINTENGHDVITGMGGASAPGMTEPVVDILNSGSIDTGNGNDVVRALAHSRTTGRLSGGGRISLGNGNDFIEGYGCQFIDGGRGLDTAKLGIAYDEELLSPGRSSMGITIGDMGFADVERFIFNDAIYSLSALQSFI